MKFIKDEEFIRGKCPMTKEEIRMVSICKMNINEESVVVDVGSGTGSITVQAALLCSCGKVISIEKEDEPFNITYQNIKKFNCSNVELIKEEGSEALSKLIKENFKCDSIFIGGSSGKLESIIEKGDEILNHGGTMVMNFITLDNTYKTVEKLKNMNYDFDISLLSISKNRKNTYMMMSLNPIYIIQCKKN